MGNLANLPCLWNQAIRSGFDYSCNMSFLHMGQKARIWKVHFNALLPTQLSHIHEGIFALTVVLTL